MRRVGWLVVALIGLRLAALIFMLGRLPADPAGHWLANDAVRFHAIGTAPGTPYRDFPVEVPPAGLALMKSVAGSDPAGTAVRLAWTQFALDVAVFAAMWFGWGSRAGATYLVVGLPLVPFIYFRADLLSVALAVLGLALIRKRAEIAGGGVLGLAVLSKFWPLVLAAVLAAERRWKALAAFGTAIAAAFAAWVAWVGVEGPRQVATFRGSQGWQIESTVGSLLLRFTDRPIMWEGDANRIGTGPPAARLATGVVLVAGLVVVALLGRRRGNEVTGVAALASVSMLLLLAPILSWQYVVWLTPWVALAWIQGERVAAIVAIAATALTTPLIFLGVELTERSQPAMAVLLARNLVLCALVALCFVRLAGHSGERWETGSHEPEQAGG